MKAVFWAVMRYLGGVGNIASQLLWYIFSGGKSRGNESVSGACARKGYVMREKIIDFFFRWKEDRHCARAAWNDRDWALKYAQDDYFVVNERPN